MLMKSIKYFIKLNTWVLCLWITFRSYTRLWKRCKHPRQTGCWMVHYRTSVSVLRNRRKSENCLSLRKCKFAKYHRVRATREQTNSWNSRNSTLPQLQWAHWSFAFPLNTFQDCLPDICIIHASTTAVSHENPRKIPLESFLRRDTCTKLWLSQRHSF